MVISLGTRMSVITEKLLMEYSKRPDGQSLSHYIWQNYLDPITDILIDGSDDTVNVGELKAAARSFAIVIACSHRSCYPTPEDVSRQSVIRRQIRLGQIPYQSTPGYGYITWNNDDPTEKDSPTRGAAPDAVKAAKAAASTPAKATPAKAAAKKPKGVLTETQRNLVKQGLGMGLGVDALAQVYGVDKALIEELVGS